MVYNALDGLDDTIVAIATAPGNAGVGIIRISGKLSTVIAQTLSKKQELPERQAIFSKIFINDEVLDHGIILFFKGSRSFTGEDVVELQLHGGLRLLHLVVAQVVKLGARQALAGEFSLRSVINDKLTLEQASSINELIHASSEQAIKAAARTLSGDLSTKFKQIAEKLTHIRSNVELLLDFSEEDVEFMQEDLLLKELCYLQQQLHTLQDQISLGAKQSAGYQVVIVGQPNVGKSSLLNYFAGTEHAIVSNIPGTTRDLIKLDLEINGLLITLVDSAGIRVSDSEIEKIGIEKSLDAAKNADLIIHLHDLSSNQEPLTLEQSCLNVYNKSDLVSANSEKIAISTKTGDGIKELSELIVKSLSVTDGSATGYTLSSSHKLLVSNITDAVDNLILSFTKSDLVLVAEELKLIQDQMASLTGKVTSDELLGNIFSKFCIGK